MSRRWFFFLLSLSGFRMLFFCVPYFSCGYGFIIMICSCLWCHRQHFFHLCCFQWKAFTSKSFSKRFEKWKTKRSLWIATAKNWKCSHWYGSSMHLNNEHAISSVTTKLLHENTYTHSHKQIQGEGNNDWEINTERKKTQECWTRTDIRAGVYFIMHIYTSNCKEPWSIKALFVSL